MSDSGITDEGGLSFLFRALMLLTEPANSFGVIGKPFLIFDVDEIAGWANHLLTRRPERRERQKLPSSEQGERRSVE